VLWVELLEVENIENYFKDKFVDPLVNVTFGK